MQCTAFFILLPIPLLLSFLLDPCRWADTAVKRPAKLQVILNPDDTRKLILPDGIPETMEQLMDEVRKVCGLNENFRLQYHDRDFGDALVNLTSTAQLEDLATVMVIPITDDRQAIHFFGWWCVHLNGWHSAYVLTLQLCLHKNSDVAKTVFFFVFICTKWTKVCKPFYNKVSQGLKNVFKRPQCIWFHTSDLFPYILMCKTYGCFIGCKIFQSS